ncbi:hypothetical protein QP572_04570 [Brevibacterium sp. UMB10442]|nr:hypothetical protein [Brevibacterium sp. UMB10442]
MKDNQKRKLQATAPRPHPRHRRHDPKETDLQLPQPEKASHLAGPLPPRTATTSRTPTPASGN